MRNYDEGDKYTMLQTLNLERQNPHIGSKIHITHLNCVKSIKNTTTLITVYTTDRSLLKAEYNMTRGFGTLEYGVTFVLEPNA